MRKLLAAHMERTNGEVLSLHEVREIPVKSQLLYSLYDHNPSENCSAKSSQTPDPQEKKKLIVSDLSY